jgi:hypothetical protein
MSLVRPSGQVTENQTLLALCRDGLEPKIKMDPGAAGARRPHTQTGWCRTSRAKRLIVV